jgi:penicillin-binding protein-related factor A (putative recombinase)
MAKSVGKQFEADFAASIPDGVYFQRIKDPAQSFGGSGNTSFSPSNPYDCYMYSYPTFFALELKTADKSMSFWRENSEGDPLKHTYNIKRNQIKALQKASEHKGVIAGFFLNFRSEDKTYFLEINKFLDLVNSIEKKSINQMDVSSCGLLIHQKKLRVHYRYDIGRFIKEVAQKQGGEEHCLTSMRLSPALATQ